MKLTEQQQAILDGAEGETKAKIMKTLIMYGDIAQASHMEPVTSDYGHLVLSFGMSVMAPVYKLMDELIDGGALSKKKFTVDPRPLDSNLPSSPAKQLAFKAMYSHQERYEEQLRTMGLLDENAFTCTCYLDEVGNKPKRGDVLSWAESSAVVYANSVLGARCNRNSGLFDLFGNIVGCVPCFGLLTDEGRQATWIIDVQTTKLPEAQVFGSAVGLKVMDAVPYIKGLDKYLGNELDDSACAYLKDFGAATASNGAVGLYHVDGLTPEAAEKGETLINEAAQIYVIDDAELERVKSNYPIMWRNPNAQPKLCFIGCPHLTFSQLCQWTDNISTKLIDNGRTKVSIPTVFTAAPAVLEKFKATEKAKIAKNMGITLSYICPLMYMNNPLCAKEPVITNSNKLRTYSNSRYCTDAEILEIITGGILQ